MKRKQVLFIAMMLPIMAMSQDATSRVAEANSQPTSQTAEQTTGIINGYEWVDLGLSVKWATMNIGATSPSDHGGHFTWSEYDAAKAKWGGAWRLPTEKELEELIDQCDWEWTFQGGHEGYRVTSKTNGNSIFLPEAGTYGDEIITESTSYWSSTRVEGITELIPEGKKGKRKKAILVAEPTASCLTFGQDCLQVSLDKDTVTHVFMDHNECDRECSIRPVSE